MGNQEWAISNSSCVKHGKRVVDTTKDDMETDFSFLGLGRMAIRSYISTQICQNRQSKHALAETET